MARNTFDPAAYNARIARLPDVVRQAAKEALESFSQQAVDLLERNIPVDHGDLKGTIKKTPGRSDLSVNISVGSSEHPYAAAIEFGHMDHGTHVPARPFFFPAMRVTKKKFKNGMVTGVRRAMKSVCAG